MPREDILQEIVRRISKLENDLKSLTVEKNQFTILNNNQLENITADQNAYDPQSYDFVFLNPTANRIINGITDGVAGRHLHLFNVSSSFTLSITHQNAGASSSNRIATKTAGTIIIPTRSWAHLVYVNANGVVTGTTRWLLLYPIA